MSDTDPNPYDPITDLSRQAAHATRIRGEAEMAAYEARQTANQEDAVAEQAMVREYSHYDDLSRLAWERRMAADAGLRVRHDQPAQPQYGGYQPPQGSDVQMQEFGNMPQGQPQGYTPQQPMYMQQPAPQNQNRTIAIIAIIVAVALLLTALYFKNVQQPPPQPNNNPVSAPANNAPTGNVNGAGFGPNFVRNLGDAL